MYMTADSAASSITPEIARAYLAHNLPMSDYESALDYNEFTENTLKSDTWSRYSLFANELYEWPDDASIHALKSVKEYALNVLDKIFSANNSIISSWTLVALAA